MARSAVSPVLSPTAIQPHVSHCGGQVAAVGARGGGEIYSSTTFSALTTLFKMLSQIFVIDNVKHLGMETSNGWGYGIKNIFC